MTTDMTRVLIHSVTPTAPLTEHPEAGTFAAAARNSGESVWLWAEVEGRPSDVEVRPAGVSRIIAASVGGVGASWKEAARESGARVADGSDILASLPLTDIHQHGGAGYSYEDSGSISDILELHEQFGTGQTIASLVANPISEVQRTCSALVSFMKSSRNSVRGNSLAGIHLEGPWLDPGHKGAHRESYLTRPRLDDAKRLLNACDGWLKQVTMAPELDDGLAVTRFLVDHGVRVAVGHTGADYETAKAAFGEGASLLTHAFNAMPGIHHRAPGPVIAALEAEHVFLEVIADGVHVAPSVIAMLFNAAPGRVVLVTDAMAAAGQTDGAYRLGSLDVVVTDGTARLATDDGSTGAIAGSTLTQNAAIRICLEAGVGADEAFAAASVNPARALGLDPAARAGGSSPTHSSAEESSTAASPEKSGLRLWRKDLTPVHGF